MAVIVLVPGFWLGQWAWTEVAGALREAGHEVYPVTLTGLADRAGEASPEVNVDTHIADIVAVVQDNDLHDVVLVGHSGANMPVTGAADRFPALFSRIVYVDTGPLPDGMAWIEFYPPEVQDAYHTQVATEGDGWLLPVAPFDAEADPVNLDGLTEPQLARMRRLGTPQPFGTGTQQLARPEVPPKIPASLIASTFTPEQLRMLADAGNPVFGLMNEMDVHHLPTGHWPMFSRPRDLAAVLDDIARHSGN
jgi:pimeloyl-ACP methyl ester carboxylesterase